MKRVFLFLLLILPLGSEEIVFRDIKGGITKDRENNVYATTWDDLIAKFSPEGNYLYTIGRKGEGPGDIKRLGGYAINPRDNNLYVIEFVGGNKWISIFSGKDGNFFGEYKIELDWKSWDGLSAIRFDSFGNAYIEAVKNKVRLEKDYIIGEVTQEVMKFSPEGSFLGHISRLSENFNISKIGGGEITIPFRNYLLWDQWNKKIVIGKTMDNFVTILDNKAKPQKKIDLPFKQESIKKENIDNWVNQMRELPQVKRGIWDIDFTLKRLKFPQYRPVFDSLLFDRKGCLFVRKSEIYGDKEKAFWVKIDIESGKVMTKSTKSDSILYIDENHIYIIKDSGNERKIIKIARTDYML